MENTVPEKILLKNNLKIASPNIHPTSFVAQGAQIIGDVVLKNNASVWYNCVLRADINKIIIGERSNIQDNSTIHLENNLGVTIGNDVTVGHNVILHGCSIDDGALIGMGSIIMNGAKVGKGAIIGAGSVITEKMVIPNFSVVVGIPGKIIKMNTKDSFDENVKWAKKYVQLAKVHKKQI